MNFQIVIKSCWQDKDRGYHDVIQATWGSDLWNRGLGRPLFILGEPQRTRPTAWNEMVLRDIPDDYDHLPEKTKAICKTFAAMGGSDRIFLCDNDTFLIPERMAEISLKDDYVGRFTPGPCEIGSTFRYYDARGILHRNCHPWASGGVGYFLSRRAAGIVAESPITSWAEDLWVGQVLGERLRSEKDITISQPPQFECWAAWHWRRSREFNNPSYDPKWMYAMWDKYKRGLL